MSWCPDTARIKKKMLYSSSFDTLKRAFVGVHKVIQANDKSECEQVLESDNPGVYLYQSFLFRDQSRIFWGPPIGFSWCLHWILIAQLWFWCFWINRSFVHNVILLSFMIFTQTNKICMVRRDDVQILVKIIPPNIQAEYYVLLYYGTCGVDTSVLGKDFI